MTIEATAGQPTAGDRAWRPAGAKPAADTVLTVTLTVTMTPDQVDSYAYEYGLDHPDALNDAQDHLQEAVDEALNAGSYFLREFTTYTVSEPVI
jgi:hypothetical protein